MDIKGSKLKQYILTNIFDYLAALDNPEYSEDEKKELRVRLSVLYSIRNLCEERGRY